MTNLTVLKDVAYTSSFLEKYLEAAVAAVGIDLPQPGPLKLDDYANLGCHSLDLWRYITLPADRTIRYLKTIILPPSSLSSRKNTTDAYIEALQQAFSEGSLDNESVFFLAGDKELMLYHEFDTAEDTYLSGNLEFLYNATKEHLTSFGEQEEVNRLIDRCRAHDIRKDGLKLTGQETDKIINIVVYHISSSDVSNSS